MVNFFSFVFVASALSMAAADSKISVITEETLLGPQTLTAITGPLLEKRDSSPELDKRGLLGNLLELPTSIISEVLPVATRTVPEPINVRASARVSFKQIKVHAYLLDTLNAILPHTHAIRRLCTGTVNPDADELSWQLVTELRAIFEILNGCLYKVKTCGKAPTPSGIPGGRTPTLDDICQLFFKIMCEIRECCKLIGSLCIKYKTVRRVCQDTLRQICGCLSNIAVRCGVEVGDMSSGLGSRFATVPNFFTGIQFGFSAFPSILGNANASFSFNASL
ncbi:hypothetical protein PGT21_028225 [Puccinia graminis f. sp. tritici]|uniref:Secreted protein n=2 Tax=Puccinia graminis f. sp. tritici TaxID=56615 RepID=A0A5B0P8A6_PUCGR|nr:hypothetical protein PGTUg99_012768 [Puccinia graminis f. sp. tritici]KAA1097247.1 hypothetical protein PGTUg99_012768 [Puccinia graminis f. sp. tritici]KAA1104616.1 hypothetical protein PGT21_028225 [Puccinia graminis f. sp. tritici]